MTANEIKVKVAQYLRYKKQMPVVAFESVCYGNNGQSDILAIDPKRYLTDVEVKLSLTDLRADINKSKHMYFAIAYHGLELIRDNIERRKTWKRAWYFQERYNLQSGRPCAVNHTKYFFFACPQPILTEATKIIERLYPYAGIYEVKESVNYDGYYVSVVKQAYPFNVDRLSLKRALVLVKGMSATLVRVSAKAEGVHLL